MSYTKEIYRKFLRGHIDLTGEDRYVKVVGSAASGTAAADSAATTHNVRRLDSVEIDIGVGATIASNKVTLPAGTYKCQIIAPVIGAVGLNRLELYNTTPDTDVLLLTSPGATGANVSVISGRFTLTEASALEIRHYTASAVTAALGQATSLTGIAEVYTTAEFWMVVNPAADTAV